MEPEPGGLGPSGGGRAVRPPRAPKRSRGLQMNVHNIGIVDYIKTTSKK